MYLKVYKSLIFGILSCIGFFYHGGITYAGVFSDELNTSTGKLAPIKSILDTELCNPTYTGVGCYQSSMGNGWYIAIQSSIGVPSSTSNSDISSLDSMIGTLESIGLPSILSNNDISSLNAIAGELESIGLPSVLLNNDSAQINNIVGIIGSIPLPNGMKSSFPELFPIAIGFEGLKIYGKEEAESAGKIKKSSLSSNIKEVLLYSTGGVFGYLKEAIPTFYEKGASIPIKNPTTYNYWEVNSNGAVIIIKKLK